MKRSSVLVYTVLRLAFFLVPLGLMLLLPVFRDNWWLAAFFAMIIGLSLSLIFLRRPLADVSTGIAERRARRADSARRRDEDDEQAEDAALDR